MTTIAELVDNEPDPTFGQPVQLDWAAPGTVRHVVELADPSAGAAVEWFDITQEWDGYSHTRGAEQPRGRYRAQSVNLELRADTDRLAPWNTDTSPTFGVHVELGPGLLVRSSFILVDGGVVTVWNPRFTCKVDFWDDWSYSIGRNRRYPIIARDTMSSLVDVPIPASTEENWSERVARTLSDAGWQYGSLIYGATFTSGAADILTVPARDAQRSAINELDVTCDPAGLVWYTNRKGQLVIRPRVDDTFHADAFEAGAAGTPWVDPDPVAFAWWACTEPEPTAASYAQDNSVTPFGLPRSARGVINHVKITYPVGGFDDDNPTSIQRNDRRTFEDEWIAENDTVAAQILATGANATLEARPLHTMCELPGFHPGPANVDYLHRVNVEHRNNDEGLIAYAEGWLRHELEECYPHGCDVVWADTFTIDVHTVTSDAGLLPVEDLTVVDTSESSAEFSWTNPTQEIEPTHTQIRLLNPASLWLTVAYPITGVAWGGLDPATFYTFGVRLVRIVDGLFTHFSPIREVSFVTDAATVPIVDIDDDGDGTINFPQPPDVCGEIDWELQESTDPDTWADPDVPEFDPTPVESGTLTDPPWTVDTSAFVFDPTKLYRVEMDACGDVTYSNLFAGQCSEPPALAGPPFDDANLVAYWPAVCPPDSVREALTESPALHGPSFGGFVLDGDQNIVLIADGEGQILYGAAPGGSVAGDSDITIACKVLPTSQPDAPAALFGHSSISLDAVAEGAYWAIQSRVQEDGAGIHTLTDGDEQDFGGWIDLAVTHDVSAGNLRVYVNAVEVAASLGLVGARTTPGTFQIGAPDGWLITNCAVWDRVLDPSELPSEAPPLTVTINQGASQADPASGLAVVFDVVFSEAVTGFATGDVTLSGTASGTLVGTVSGSGTTFTVTVTGMTSSGTVIASIAAGVCIATATGVPNEASTSTDNTVTFVADLVYWTILSKSPDRYFPGRETSGTNMDDATGGTDGTWGGGIDHTEDGPDGAKVAHYNAVTNARAVVPDADLFSPQTAGGLTVGFLVRLHTLSIQRSFIAKRQVNIEWQIRMGQSDNTTVEANTYTTSDVNARQRISPTATLATGNWYRVIVRFSSSATGYPTMRINGSASGSNASTGTARGNTTDQLVVGASGSTATSIHGDIAHVFFKAGNMSDADCLDIENADRAMGYYA